MKQYTLVHPRDPTRNEVIRFADDGNDPVGGVPGRETVRNMFNELNELCPGCIRVASLREIDELDITEQDMEAHEKDVGYIWPDDKDKIRQKAWCWANPYSFRDILSIIVDNAGECNDANSTYAFIRRTEDGKDRTSFKMLHVFLEVLNFSAVREQSKDIKAITTQGVCEPHKEGT